MNGSVAQVPRLAVRSLDKSFGDNRVLRRLDWSVLPGEIHALVGGNGAGKSTLSKIVAGLELPQAGEMTLDGADYRPANRRAAAARGVVLVLQELTVLPTLSIAENLFLPDLPASWMGVIDRRELETRARRALRRVGLDDLDPFGAAAELGIGHQQMIEIAAGLDQECRLLILDEPTAALTPKETRALFNLLRALRAAGTAIVYISHRLEELARIADRVSVLRDGQLVATLPIAEANHDRLIELMAGSASLDSPAESGERSNVVALEVRDLQAASAVRGVSLNVRQGEIVGLGGLIGAGRTELLRAIFGADRATAGEIFVGADCVPVHPRAPADMIAHGFAFVPEDRKQHGLLAALSVRENAVLPQLAGRRSLLGAVDQAAERVGVARLVERLAVRCVDAEQAIAELSGGNQQKVVVARWLERDVRVWLLDEPTRGVDVDARRRIYALLRERAARGESVLLASSDYEELATVCDRVLVMSNGVLTAEFTRASLTPERFMAAAFQGFSSAIAE